MPITTLDYFFFLHSSSRFVANGKAIKVKLSIIFRGLWSHRINSNISLSLIEKDILQPNQVRN